MPIRFRCAYCNQLLGIARRKAGQVVRCPTCAGQVVVPNPEADEPLSPPAAGNNDQMLFERSDFDNLLNDPEPESPAALGPPPAPPPLLPPPPPAPAPVRTRGGTAALDAERPPSSTTRPPGIVLTPTAATVLTVVVILALAVAFGAGWLIRYLF
jgi:hypothetical protein